MTVSDFERKRIFIGIPTQDTWKAAFGQCLIQAFEHVRNLDVDVTLNQSRGTLLNDMRTHLVEQAMLMGATHIMFFDNDMTFPHDTIARLLAHKKPMVGANYSMRRRPCYPTSKSADGKSYVYTDHMSTGLEECMAGGFGVVLIETGLFEAVSRPWFDGGEARSTFNTSNMAGFGEDYFFCYKCRQETGQGFWVDHDLSKQVGHIGEHVYTFEDSLSDRVEARMIKDGRLEKPGEVLPHDKYSDIINLAEKGSPEELARWTKDYHERVGAEERAQENAILAENEARLKEFMAA